MSLWSITSRARTHRASRKVTRPVALPNSARKELEKFILSTGV